jgi:hypothetical protein
VRIQHVVAVPGNATVTRVSSGGAVRIPVRRARRFDDLAAELGRLFGVSAEVRDSGLPEPGAGTLVVCRPDVLDELADRRPRALLWVVGVDLLRGYVLDEAETHGLAAAVSVPDYGSWVHGQGGAPAIYGRREVAATVGADLVVDPLQVTARYARITSPRAISLPELLGTYLAALEPRLPERTA